MQLYDRNLHSVTCSGISDGVNVHVHPRDLFGQADLVCAMGGMLTPTRWMFCLFVIILVNRFFYIFFGISILFQTREA